MGGRRDSLYWINGGRQRKTYDPGEGRCRCVQEKQTPVEFTIVWKSDSWVKSTLHEAQEKSKCLTRLLELGYWYFLTELYSKKKRRLSSWNKTCVSETLLKYLKGDGGMKLAVASLDQNLVLITELVVTKIIVTTAMQLWFALWSWHPCLSPS